ncbi:Uma2 family endonuclease [Benzoatithermus flavus]|uniref:Uma2 family endonuclease n=1 Tax=Benzoatithermus flavus TaxID=3108223 RepID=A0ABU8XMT7_9PROT
MAKRRAESDLPRTVEEFDRWYAQRPERWEFIAGVPVMMVPGANNRTIIKGNVFRPLASRLAGKPCRPLGDGPEVKSHQLSAIPVVVTCSPVEGRAGHITDPAVIVEMLSPSSERDDTGRKWQGYCLIPSLRHYLAVAQDKRFVTVHTRTGPDSFEERFYLGGTIDLPAIGAQLSLDEIYEGVTFEAEPADD